MEKFSFTITTAKKGFHELTLLAATFDEQEEWVTAIEEQMHSLTNDGQSPGGGTSPSSPLKDKSGWLDLAGACNHHNHHNTPNSVFQCVSDIVMRV